jgi:hypothetical protein
MCDYKESEHQGRPQLSTILNAKHKMSLVLALTVSIAGKTTFFLFLHPSFSLAEYPLMGGKAAARWRICGCLCTLDIPDPGGRQSSNFSIINYDFHTKFIIFS